MNQKLVIFFKFLDLAFHVADIYSDIATTALYYQTCQMTFFYLSLTIFFTSYLSTVISLRYALYYKSTWTQAIGYPLKTMKILMKKIFTMVFSSLVYPINDEQRLMDDIWLHNVKVVEIFSESFPQFALNIWVIKVYGVSDLIQLLSALLALIGLLKIQVDRLCLIRDGEEFGMASWSYVKSFLDLSIPWLTGFIFNLIGLSEDCMPAWLLLAGPFLAHPIISWISLIFNHKKHTPKTKSSLRHYSVYAYTLQIISIFIGYTFFTINVINPGLLVSARKSNFDQCNSNFSAINAKNPYFNDFMSQDQVKWWYWLWLLAVINLILLLLWTNAKTIPRMEKWFGQIVTSEELVQGPICPQDAVIPNPIIHTQSDPVQGMSHPENASDDQSIIEITHL